MLGEHLDAVLLRDDDGAWGKGGGRGWWVRNVLSTSRTRVRHKRLWYDSLRFSEGKCHFSSPSHLPYSLATPCPTLLMGSSVGTQARFLALEFHNYLPVVVGSGGWRFLGFKVREGEGKESTTTADLPLGPSFGCFSKCTSLPFS